MWLDQISPRKVSIFMWLLQHCFLPSITSWSWELLTIYAQTIVITLLVQSHNSFLRHIVFTRLAYSGKHMYILPCLLNNTATLHYCTICFTQTKRRYEHSLLANIHMTLFFIYCSVLFFVDTRASLTMLGVSLYL